MAFFKTKYTPISKNAFRIYSLFFVIPQFICILILALVLNIFEINFSPVAKINPIYLYICFVSLNCMLMQFFYDSNIIRGRFKEVYPQSELTELSVLILGFFPFMFFLLVIFLCFKDEGIYSSRAPRLVSNAKFICVLVLAFNILQFASPTLSYWTANPSLYYITDTIHSTFKIIKFKDQIQADKPLLSQINELNLGQLRSTEIVLLTAVSAAKVIKEKDRKIANNESKTLSSYDSFLALLSHSCDLLELSQQSTLKFSSFSLVQWLHFSGPVEIMILSSIESDVKRKFNQTMIEKFLSMSNNFEKKLYEIPVKQRAEYYRRLAHGRRRLLKLALNSGQVREPSSNYK